MFGSSYFNFTWYLFTIYGLKTICRQPVEHIYVHWAVQIVFFTVLPRVSLHLAVYMSILPRVFNIAPAPIPLLPSVFLHLPARMSILPGMLLHL